MSSKVQVLGRVALAAAAGAASFLACATFDQSYLMWIGLVPLLVVIRDRSPRSAFFYGWVTGFVANAGGFYWIAGLLVRFGHMPLAAAMPLWWLLCLYQGLIVALFAWLLTLARRRAPGLPVTLLAPVLMTALELCFPLVFPWYFAITQAWVRPVIQIADLTGPLGVTFLLLLTNGAVFDLLDAALARRAWPWRRAVAAAGVVALALVYGQVRIRQVEARRAAAPKVQVGLVQANVGIVEKGRWALAPRHLALHQELSARLEKEGAQLIVWPESSYPYYFIRGQRQDWTDEKALMRHYRTPTLFGSITGSRSERFPFNTALMMDDEGRITGSFDKVFLLIFGEYVPFYEQLESTISKYVPEAGNFARGKDPAVFPFKQYRLGPMICYEDIIPEFGRRLAKLKPNLFVNITNDAWFGRTSEPYEHMALAVYRTVEHRVDMVRAVNTGVSAYIDATGRVYRRSRSVDPQLTPDAPPVALLDEVAMLEPASVYGAVGDLFGELCFALALYLVLVHRRLGRA
jgi:apolipoprotein N-acyltransferase